MSVHKSQVTKQLKERKYFTQVPNEIFLVNISIHARLIWTYLMSEGPGWDSSVSNIAANLGISRSTATRAVKELRNCGTISTRQTKSGTNFTMNTSDRWKVEWIGVTPPYLVIDDAADASPLCAPVDPLGAAVDLNDGMDPRKIESAVEPSVGGIQDFNKTNTLNTSNNVD